jgi:hypothetical protein
LSPLAPGAPSKHPARVTEAKIAMQANDVRMEILSAMKIQSSMKSLIWFRPDVC